MDISYSKTLTTYPKYLEEQNGIFNNLLRDSLMRLDVICQGSIYKFLVYETNNVEHEHWLEEFLNKIERDGIKSEPSRRHVEENIHRGVTLFALLANNVVSIITFYMMVSTVDFDHHSNTINYPNRKNFISEFESLPNILNIACARTLKKYEDKDLTNTMLYMVFMALREGGNDDLEIGWIITNASNSHHNEKTRDNINLLGSFIESSTLKVMKDSYGFKQMEYVVDDKRASSDFMSGFDKRILPLFAFPDYIWIGQESLRRVYYHEKNRIMYGIHILNPNFNEMVKRQEHECLGFKHLTTTKRDSSTLDDNPHQPQPKKSRFGCQVCGILIGDLMACDGCKDVVYCGKQCQQKDWKSHSQICTPIQKRINL